MCSLQGFEIFGAPKTIVNTQMSSKCDNSDCENTIDVDCTPSIMNSTDTESEMDLGEHVADNYAGELNIEIETGEYNEVEWFTVAGQHNPFLLKNMSSCKRCVPDASQTPDEFYYLLIDDDVIQSMVIETNRNAHQVISKGNIKGDSRVNSWTDTNVQEIKQFLGLFCWMGMIRMSSIDSYWRTTSLFKNVFAPQTMTRNRFQLLLKMWHFSNIGTAPEGDRNFKVSELLKIVLSQFVAATIPSKDIVIDESMISFRGWLKFRQYLPAKAHKYGIKLFKPCDPKGYTYNNQSINQSSHL